MSLINPRQTVLVSCRANLRKRFSEHEEVKDNIITLDWHMQTSFQPMLYAISVGKTRYSLELIKKSKVFVVNFMPANLKDKALFCGRNSGEAIDKFSASGLHKEEANSIDCPRVVEAVGYLECEVISEVETGDHVIFIGKVIKSHLKKDAKRVFHITGDSFTTTLE